MQYHFLNQEAQNQIIVKEIFEKEAEHFSASLRVFSDPTSEKDIEEVGRIEAVLERLHGLISESAEESDSAQERSAEGEGISPDPVAAPSADLHIVREED